MATEQKLELTVKVNSDTGQLDIVANKLGNLDSIASSLITTFGTIGTATAFLEFLKNSVKAAEQESESLRRLSFLVDQTGQSFSTNKNAIISWAKEIQNSTRFSDTEALSVLERMIRATGDLSTAQSASSLAMDISVRTGMDLARSQDLLFALINGNVRALREARREFGDLVRVTDSNQDVMNKLNERFRGAAKEEESLTKQTSMLANAFKDLQKDIGKPIDTVLENISKKMQTGSKEIAAWASESATALAKFTAAWSTLGLSKVGQAPLNDLKKSFQDIAGLTKKSAEEAKKNPPIKNFIPTRDELAEVTEEFKAAMDDIYRHRKAVIISMKKDTADWIDSEVNTMRFFKDTVKNVSESMVKDFTTAVSQSIVQGKNLEDSMKMIMENITEKIIEAITQMLIFRSIATAIGGPFGGFVPFGASGSPSMPRINPMPPSALSQNPSAIRALAANIRTAQSFEKKPLGF